MIKARDSTRRSIRSIAHSLSHSQPSVFSTETISQLNSTDIHPCSCSFIEQLFIFCLSESSIGLKEAILKTSPLVCTKHLHVSFCVQNNFNWRLFTVYCEVNNVIIGFALSIQTNINFYSCFLTVVKIIYLPNFMAWSMYEILSSFTTRCHWTRWWWQWETFIKRACLRQGWIHKADF